MSLLKNSYADLYNDATGGSGGGPATSLSGLNDCNNQTLIDTLSIGIKASGINTSGNVLVMNNTPTFTNIGAENTLIGNCCENTTGGAGFLSNTAVGSACLSNCISDSNTCLGHQSGAFITSGARNTFCGVESGQGSSTGSDNVCIGFSSGVGLNNASNCCMIGSGTENQGDVNGLICIGYQVHGNIANGLFFPTTLAPVINNPQSKLMTFNNLSGNAGPTSLVSANGYLKNTAGVLSWESVTPATAGYSLLTIYTTPVSWIREGNLYIPFETLDVSKSNGSMSNVNSTTIKFEQTGTYQIDVSFQIFPTTTGALNLTLENWNLTTNNMVGNPARMDTATNTVIANEVFTLSSFSVLAFNQNDELSIRLNTNNTPIATGSQGSINRVNVKITRIS